MEHYKFSIIIPAYNEETLITKTLITLLQDNNLHNIELLVICNGCSDQTFSKTQSFINENSLSLKNKKIDFLLFETSKASKTNALNIGINNSHGLIKVFIDADIQICGKDVNLLISELQNKKLKAISPRVNFSFDNSSFWVRQYYRVASLSFYNANTRLSNVIALSEAGIKQITPLPNVIADDEYIRRQFTENERAVSQHCSLIFLCAKKLKDLIQVLTRVERGNVQLNRHYNNGHSEKAKQGYYKLPILHFPTFILIKFIVKIRARIQFAQGRMNQWERDESNRNN